MQVSEALVRYLKDNNESMRSLSLRSGLGEKAVADIINLPGLKPRAKTIKALSNSTGIDLRLSQDVPPTYYSDLISRLGRDGKSREVGRMRWLIKVTGWVPETETVCRREVVEFLRSRQAVEFSLTDGSFATYSSEAIAIVSAGEARSRKRNVSDMEGIYASVHSDMTSKKCTLKKWQVGLAGSFLLFLHDQGIKIPDITTETLAAYYVDRLEMSSKTEEKCRRHVIEIANLLKDLGENALLKKYGFCPIAHPFEKSAWKYGVTEEAIAHLLAEFDANIAPWALGEASRNGLPLNEFIAELDKLDENVSDKKALLLKRRAERAARPGQSPVTDTRSSDELLAGNGFLTNKENWSVKTLRCRRGYMASLAKAIISSADIVPDSMDELLDPDFLETAVVAIKDANIGEFSSGYLGSILKCARKIARDFQCRPDEDIARINKLLEFHDRKRRGIAPRNRAKLREFDENRIQRTIDLGDMIMTDVNAGIDQRRKAHRKKHGVLPSPADVIDAELGRDIMAAIAHEILLRNAPRSDNLINARLDWVSWQGDLARITVPAVNVKMRSPDDDDLTIFLGERQSKLLRHFVDTVRGKCLISGDERNPYLFPGQVRKDEWGQPYKSLLKRATRLLNMKVGSKINPHLYRHLVGWIWLKDSIDHLPKVQRLLGHKNLQTTIDYYAELDPSLVFDEWNEHLNNKSSTGKARAA